MERSQNLHHLIVGDGVTALALVEAVPLISGDRLTIVGRTANAFGRGAAYGAEPQETPWRYAYLLNSPADDIDPDFADWAAAEFDRIHAQMQGRSPNWVDAAKDLVSKGDLAGLNYPRSTFGEYLEEQGRLALKSLQDKGVAVDVLTDEALSVAQNSSGLDVTLASGRVLSADRVDVAPGAPTTQRVEGDDSDFSVPTLFGFEDKIAEHVRSGREIFCVGTNATMLDSLRLCQSLVSEDRLSFVACSPSGRLPAPLIPQLPRRTFVPRPSKGHATAESFLSELQEQISAAESEGLAIREVRAGMRAFFVENNIADFVRNPDEAPKVPAQLRHWLRAGTRDNIQDFERLAQTGQTRLLSGSVDKIVPHGTGATVHYRDADGQPQRLETGLVINCSGSVMTAGHDPLTQNMIDQELLSISRAGYVVGKGCKTAWDNLRHLSPATAKIGDEILPMPLFDAHLLRVWAQRCYA